MSVPILYEVLSKLISDLSRSHKIIRKLLLLRDLTRLGKVCSLRRILVRVPALEEGNDRRMCLVFCHLPESRLIISPESGPHMGCSAAWSPPRWSRSKGQMLKLMGREQFSGGIHEGKYLV